jgi:hypothetical protein
MIISGGMHGKRKVNTFNLMKEKNVHPETRKIGNIEVYVDTPVRRNYALEDYAKYIET